VKRSRGDLYQWSGTNGRVKRSDVGKQRFCGQLNI